MDIRDDIVAIHEEMMQWRHEMHKSPATAFEEDFVSGFVQEKLDEWGITYKSGYGRTGLVATIEGASNNSGRVIGLRCDMDGLDIQEDSGRPWTSRIDGKMHGCGHDGHVSMMLGAIKYIKDNTAFDGTVHFIFQPAEETLCGARAMLGDGLFNDFPCDEIYGLHNWPWIPRGKFGYCDGALMAAVSYLEVNIVGKAGHSGMINDAIDPVIIGCEIISAMQTLISQTIDPLEPAIIYFPIFETGVTDAGVVPERVVLKGVLRTFSSGLRSQLEQKIRKLCNNIATAHNGTASVEVTCDSDEVFNHKEPSAIAHKVAASIVGESNVDAQYKPVMSGEDFGLYVRQIPGAFMFIGQGEPENPHDAVSYSLHSPYYDFNDQILPIGVEYWVKLVETALPAK